MKRVSILFIIFFIIGCGGGRDNNDFNTTDIKPLVEGQIYYEENLCKDPEYRSYIIEEESLTMNSFSDPNYSDLVTTDSYPIVKFEGNDMEIIKDGERLNCFVGYEIIDNKVITMLELDCIKTSEIGTSTALFFFAYDTKERAHSHRVECK